MSDIKVIEGLEPWEVMKRASEGEPVAYRDTPEWDGGVVKGWIEVSGVRWDFTRWEYAIIGTTTPEIDWDEFDWDFFNQYGKLSVRIDGGKFPSFISCKQSLCKGEVLLIEPSPFYCWLGGEQPVPDGVEVVVILRKGTKYTYSAITCIWAYESVADSGDDIIAFKLTGNTCG